MITQFSYYYVTLFCKNGGTTAHLGTNFNSTKNPIFIRKLLINVHFLDITLFSFVITRKKL